MIRHFRLFLCAGLTLALLSGCTRDRIADANWVMEADSIDMESALEEKARREALAAASGAPAPINYVVQDGDTLSLVADRHGTTVEAIRELNPTLTSDRVFSGDEILVPFVPGAAEAEPEVNELVYYTIQPGDIVSAIALEYRISLEDIQNANPLVDLDQVPVGHKLVLPVSASLVEEEQGEDPNRLYYTVVEGDTLNDIAARYDVSAEDIVALNDLNSKDQLRIGQRLALPDEAIISAVEDTAVLQGGVTHIVAAGETLSGIALYYEVSTRTLIEANNLGDGDQIAAGQTLFIPGVTPRVQAGSQQVYLVQAGDTLLAIAREHNVTLGELLGLNQLRENDIISIGQQILIPVPVVEEEEE